MRSTPLLQVVRGLHRHVRLIGIFPLVFLLLSAGKSRADGGDFQYQSDDAGVIVTRYVGAGGAVAIPGELGGGVVTRIGGSAFLGMTNLTSVIIPNSVTNIGSLSFQACSNLTSLTLGNRVAFLGNAAFRYCVSLTNVVIPDSVVAIGDWTFRRCVSLTSVEIPHGVTSLGTGTFSACTGLRSVTIPETLTHIRSQEFRDCVRLETLLIPNSVTIIDDTAFEGCSSLTHVVIPSSVITLDLTAFASCPNLAAIDVDAGNPVYGSVDGALMNEALSSILFVPAGKVGAYTVPDSVIAIQDSVFNACARLDAIQVGLLNPSYSAVDGVLFNKTKTELLVCPRAKGGAFEIPNSVTNMGAWAFGSCQRLTRVTIGAGITSIRPGWFFGCGSLERFALDPLNASFHSIDGVLFNTNESILTAYPPGRAGAYAIPDSVKSIGGQAFSTCAVLTSVTIPDSVTRIESSAFSYCHRLESITIPNSVTNVDPFAFMGCSGLTSASIGDGVTSIPSWMFEYCTSLTNVSFGSKVTSLGFHAFAHCSNLTRFAVPPGVSVLPLDTLLDCARLTSVILPGGVTNLDFGTFPGCWSLTSVYFEGNAPNTTSNLFLNSPFATAFYHPGTTGWGPTLAGRPTAIWVPLPPYSDWIISTGLTTLHPGASGGEDDPDGDGLTNLGEWVAGTDPSRRDSALALDPVPRREDLIDSDRTPVPSDQRALYVDGVPGRYYGIQSATTIDGPWQLEAVRVASSAQTRFLVPKNSFRVFYRVSILQ